MCVNRSDVVILSAAVCSASLGVRTFARQPKPSVFGCRAMPKFFFAKQCPLAHECTPQAWKRSACWDYDEDECRVRVFDHLTKSSLHLAKRDEAIKLSDSAELGLEDDEQEGHPLAKRQRKEEPRVIGASPKASGPEVDRTSLPKTPQKSPPQKGPPQKGTLQAASEIAATVAEAVKSTLQAVKEELAADRAAEREAASASASSSQTQPCLQPAPQRQMILGSHPCPKANPPLLSGSAIGVVRMDTVQMAVEALERAHVAAMHARNLCAAAGSVFEMEARVILDAKNALAEVMRS